MFIHDSLRSTTIRGCLIAAILALSFTAHAGEGKTDQPGLVNKGNAHVAPPTPKSDIGSNPTQSAAPPAQPKPKAVITPGTPRFEEFCDDRCLADEQREKADLVAQQNMAKSASDLAYLTILQIVVGFIGIVLLIITLRYTRVSTKAATAAAESAERAVAVTTNTATNQLRAYVFINECHRTRRVTSDPWVIQTTIKNFGQTPAYDVKLYTEKSLIETTAEATFTFPDPTLQYSFDLAPGHSHTFRFELPELNDATWGEFKALEKNIYFWGRIEFKDAFRKDRWITFRMFQSGGYVKNFMNCDEGNKTSDSE